MIRGLLGVNDRILPEKEVDVYRVLADVAEGEHQSNAQCSLSLEKYVCRGTFHMALIIHYTDKENLQNISQS